MGILEAAEHAIVICTRAVKALREKGVTFNIYPGFPQNELGMLTLPGGTVRVAWFKDADGNVLSVTNV